LYKSFDSSPRKQINKTNQEQTTW